MERFQKIKSKKRKLDISSICRFCGLENDERYNILQLNEDGVDFSTKISSMIGINVHLRDQMPQNVCFICMDKINDFYEFRLMALNTEKQTREALGLPLVEEKPKPKVNPIETLKPAVVRLVDIKYSTQDRLLIEKALGRLSRSAEENIPNKRAAVAPPSSTITSQPLTKKARKDISCNICTDAYFSYLSDLQDHQIKEHLPLISKYACGSCRETFEQLSDFKEHESMHSKMKLPYTCYICLSLFAKLRDFQKHMTNYNCKSKVKLEVTFEDIKCFQCKKKFITQNLFEWHGCFLKTRGSCLKCGLYFPKKKALLKHYVLCEGEFVTPESARDPNRSSIKSEMISPSRGSIVRVTNTNASKGVRKKTVPQRRNTTIKAEKEINLTAANVTQQQDDEDEDDEYANYEEDITYDNFGSDDDDDDDAGPNLINLEPVVELGENHQNEATSLSTALSSGPRIIDIKAEISTERLAIRQHTLDTQIIRDIKKEQGSRQAVVSTSKTQQQNSLTLRIKAERGVNEQPVVQVLNPFNSKSKLFKLPPELTARIKKEKMQAEYGDGLRDEAIADPEEEAQMERDQNDSQLTQSSLLSKVKKEKVDFDVIQKKKVNSKQLINPMAVAMLREKNASANASENGEGGGSNNSLMIAAVMSVNPMNGSEQQQIDSTPPTHSHENNNIGSTLVVPASAVVDGGEEEVLNPVMVEIPAEFSKEHYSPVTNTITTTTAKDDELMLSSIVTTKENNEVATTTVTDNVTTTTEAMNTNDDDELNQLLENLEKFGSDDINVENNLEDSDLQDLLKFD